MTVLCVQLDFTVIPRTVVCCVYRYAQGPPQEKVKGKRADPSATTRRCSKERPLAGIL
mgnify:CR=1 FL=1